MSEIKIMLSSPMKGKTREQIDSERKNMIGLLLDTFDNSVVIESVIENPEGKTELECFSESIFHMSQCDILAMGQGWEHARGCKLEHEIAKSYGMEVIYIQDIMGC